MHRALVLQRALQLAAGCLQRAGSGCAFSNMDKQAIIPWVVCCPQTLHMHTQQARPHS